MRNPWGEEVALAGLKDILRKSLAGMLGAAAVEGAVGLLISQKRLLGRWAPGSPPLLLLAASNWQKACIAGRLIPICVSSSSCTHQRRGDNICFHVYMTALCTGVPVH